jgi:hypothetical protein
MPGSVPAAPIAPGDLRGRVLAYFQQNLMMHSALEGTRIEAAPGGDRIVVHVISPKKIYRDRLMSPGVQQEVAKVLRELHGHEARVEFVAGEAPAAAAAPRVLAKDAQPGPATKRVMEKFRGRIVQVNPEDRIVDEPVADGGADEAPVEDVPPPPED